MLRRAWPLSLIARGRGCYLTLPLCPCEAGQPDFLEFSSRNSVRWKFGLDYTVTNDVGKQGKTDRPHASKRPEPDFLENNSRNSGEGCPVCEFRRRRAVE
jgi:hypothetical protein